MEHCSFPDLKYLKEPLLPTGDIVTATFHANFLSEIWSVINKVLCHQMPSSVLQVKVEPFQSECVSVCVWACEWPEEPQKATFTAGL